MDGKDRKTLKGLIETESVVERYCEETGNEKYNSATALQGRYACCEPRSRRILERIMQAFDNVMKNRCRRSGRPYVYLPRICRPLRISVDEEGFDTKLTLDRNGRRSHIQR